MDSRSLLEFLEQEKRICDRLQSVQNMLGGLQSAAADNRTSLERHGTLVDRLTEEAMALNEKLWTVRQQINERITGYECMYGGKNHE